MENYKKPAQKMGRGRLRELLTIGLLEFGVLDEVA